MPRQSRFFVPDCPLHLVQRGNNRQPTFFDEEDRLAYLTFLRVAAKRFGVAIHAYVLMTNHVHILATPPDPLAVPRMMQKAVRNFTVRFNGRHRRTGCLWEGRYRASVVDADAYLLACMRYIELNPVRAGLCARPVDYPWSSHGENAGASDVPWIEPHPVYRALARTISGRRAAYRGLFSETLAAPLLDRIRDAARYEWALGEDRFRQAIEAQGSRRCQRLPRGPRI